MTLASTVPAQQLSGARVARWGGRRREVSPSGEPLANKRRACRAWAGSIGCERRLRGACSTEGVLAFCGF